jgi:hypothetical protein
MGVLHFMGKVVDNRGKVESYGWVWTCEVLQVAESEFRVSYKKWLTIALILAFLDMVKPWAGVSHGRYSRAI